MVHDLGLARLSASETVELAISSGRTLVEPLAALSDLPSLTTSAMDGWVVAGPGPWSIGREIVAGDAPDGSSLAVGTARPITTGAPVPRGALAVVRSESGEVERGLLTMTAQAPPRTGHHLRLRGEEARLGEELLPSGTRLTAPRIALAAVAGHDTVAVRRVPTVGLLLLGSEVIMSGVPGDGLVRDAYSPQLPALIESLGAVVSTSRRVQDRLETTIEHLGTTSADLVLSTGGTAAGTTDHIRAALTAVGARIVIDGLDVRPGHPTIVALLEDGRPVLCLPGNPLAAMMMFATLGMPLIEGMLGRSPRGDGSRVAAEEFANPGRGPRLVAYRDSPSGARPSSRQGSGMLRGLATSDGVAIVPAGGTTAGDILRILPTPW